jgi:hypothetical protein
MRWGLPGFLEKGQKNYCTPNKFDLRKIRILAHTLMAAEGGKD